MSLEDLKTRNNLSLEEITLLLDHETDTKIYKKLCYFKFKAMGFSKVESYTIN